MTTRTSHASIPVVFDEVTEYNDAGVFTVGNSSVAMILDLICSVVSERYAISPSRATSASTRLSSSSVFPLPIIQRESEKIRYPVPDRRLLVFVIVNPAYPAHHSKVYSIPRSRGIATSIL